MTYKYMYDLQEHVWLTSTCLHVHIKLLSIVYGEGRIYISIQRCSPRPPARRIYVAPVPCCRSHWFCSADSRPRWSSLCPPLPPSHPWLAVTRSWWWSHYSCTLPAGCAAWVWQGRPVSTRQSGPWSQRSHSVNNKSLHYSQTTTTNSWNNSLLWYDWNIIVKATLSIKHYQYNHHFDEIKLRKYCTVTMCNFFEEKKNLHTPICTVWQD